MISIVSFVHSSIPLILKTPSAVVFKQHFFSSVKENRLNCGTFKMENQRSKEKKYRVCNYDYVPESVETVKFTLSITEKY